MRYFKLTIAYDGTDFHGWQMQGDKPTIQGEIVNVLQRLTQEKIFLHGVPSRFVNSLWAHSSRLRMKGALSFATP